MTLPKPSREIPPEIFAQIEARQAALEQARAAARDQAIPALQVLVNAIRGNPGTGQVGRLIGFLAGLYNGPRFPFDMTDLRGLDHELGTACIAVLNYDRFSEREIHHWGVISADELNALMKDDGHYYRAQRRRIGRELYDTKFGERGHPDEGLTG